MTAALVRDALDRTESQVEAASPGATPPRSSARPELVLSPAQACDLDLHLAGVDVGGVLGEPWLPRSSTDPARVELVAAVEVVKGGGLQLRDQEHTPVATLSDVVRDGDRVSGLVSPGRTRESGPLTGLRAALVDPATHERPTLVLARPPVEADSDELDRWAAEAAGRPALVLLPEGGTRPGHPPLRVSHRLAVDLLDRLGLHGATVAVAPLLLRDPVTDDRLARAITRRVGAVPALHLTDAGPEAGAAVWRAARARLLAGDGPATLDDVPREVEPVLRRWRPRREERGLVVLMTGLSGSGKSTLARDLDAHLTTRTTRTTTLLDGDVVRRLLSAGLGFDPASRELNVRRIGWVAARVAEHGGTAICSPIAPFATTRHEVRDMVEAVADLVLVHVSTPLQECERRDLKGLYAAARRGEIPDFTGISSPYEAPTDADVTVDTSTCSRAEALALVVGHLRAGGWLGSAE